MATIRTYLIGFALSILLTLIAFGLLGYHLESDHTFPSHELIVPLLIGLALLQFIVQLVCFLHLGQEHKPRWNVVAFAFAVFVVAVVVGGSLWIMGHLQHQMQDTREVW
jgi:cytochrome o ubiquinol oxidase operon protein cyoD